MSRAPSQLQKRPDGPGKNPGHRPVADPDVLIISLYGRDMAIDLKEGEMFEDKPEDVKRYVESLPAKQRQYLESLPDADAVAETLFRNRPAKRKNVSVITRDFFSKLTEADREFLKFCGIEREL